MDQYSKNGEQRIRYNRELYKMYGSPNIITEIKIARLRWAGHIQRMNDSENVKRIMGSKPELKRKI